ncbi:hypothetical protein [Streptomyces sp. NPDC021224]|uniref:hypothetical protein n=1 Tax=unclassified Streptomyces TaxID=2593676 RepID=UPI0037A64094
MVRRSQSSNPRSVVVLTSGTDWGTRAAVQRRASGAEFPMPRRQVAKLNALRQTMGTIRSAINARRWHQARYWLSQAQALVNALPADQTKQEREQLSLLRKKYAARGTPAAKNAAKAKAKVAPRAGGRKAAAKTTRKKTQAKTTQTPKPTPVPDLADRGINRAALGYAAPDVARRPREG